MRVPRTFVFVDLSGFTRYAEERGDIAAGDVLSAFRAVAREVASDRGVRIAKWLGDGCMVVAMEHNDAIVFALELQRRATSACEPLAMRAGIASGYALLFEGDDYIGTTVNLAARICDAADRAEVLVPIEQAVELPMGVSSTPHEALVLRGFPEPIQVVALSGDPHTASRNDTGELWTRTPFAL